MIRLPAVNSVHFHVHTQPTEKCMSRGVGRPEFARAVEPIGECGGVPDDGVVEFLAFAFRKTSDELVEATAEIRTEPLGERKQLSQLARDMTRIDGLRLAFDPPEIHIGIHSRNSKAE